MYYHSLIGRSSANFLGLRCLSLCLTTANLPSLACYSTAREARFMNKIMGRNQTKGKFRFYDGTEGISPTNSTGYRPMNKRRISVLNKLFMKNITEVLATGSMTHSIEGLGIEINKVEVACDFKHINVLYICKTKPQPPGLEEILVDAGYSLRHELSKLKLMGRVPNINFVKDKTMMRIIEVEELLAVADKGTDEDYEPSEEQQDYTNMVDGWNYMKVTYPDTDVMDWIRKSCIRGKGKFCSVPPDVFFKYLEIEAPLNEVLESVNTCEQVYKLNHSRIMDKILASKKASSSSKREKDIPHLHQGQVYSPVQNPVTGPQLSDEHPKHLISNFLKQNRQD